MYGPITDELGLRPGCESLYAQWKEKFTCKTDLPSARGASVASLRFMCGKNEIATAKGVIDWEGGGITQFLATFPLPRSSL